MSTCGTLEIVSRCGEVYAESMPFPPVHSGLPVSESKADIVPARETITEFPETTGEPQIPQSGISMPESSAVFRAQIMVPSIALIAFRIPVAPIVYTRPLASTGVARGPAPACES